MKNNLINVLKQETETLANLVHNFPDSALPLVQEIMQTRGRIVFSGMGKSGHVGRKLSATFSSTGTPSLFLHPSEALHGDLGMVHPSDYFIALSKSGTGKELEQVLKVLKLQGNKTALICCASGILSTTVDLTVQLPFEREACELNLAPTSSSTMMIAFGDAIAVTVSKTKGFESNDFARTHPAGALGKKLLCTVESFMYKETELPFVQPQTPFSELIVHISQKKLGVGIVVTPHKNLLGIITDGDLRRACEIGPELFNKTAGDIMHQNPKTIDQQAKAYRALEIMEQFNITSLVVLQDTKVVGLVHIHDLIKAGIKS